MTRVTLIPGDGIGPEVTASARQVVDTVYPGIEWEEVQAGERAFAKLGTPVPDALIQSIQRTRVALKGPLTNPPSGYSSPNLQIYQLVGVWYRVRVAEYFEGAGGVAGTRITLIRDTKEGWIKGAQHDLNDDAGIALSFTTKSGTERITRAAFEYARAHQCRRVTVAHQGRVLRSTDGRYVNTALEVAGEYPDLDVTEELLDSLCMHLVMRPRDYEVLLVPNPYGGALEGVCAGLTGGAGLMASSNLGDDVAIFEASHGTAPRLAGTNTSNPAAVLIAAAGMLAHIGRHAESERIRAAVREVIQESRVVTYDLGGSATTQQMTEAICERL